MSSRTMKILVTIAIGVFFSGRTHADVFNMGSGLTSLEMVPVGNINNPADTRIMNTDLTTGYGSVNYAYSIGKYDITAGQYAEFLSVVASDGPGPTTDPFGLYDSRMAINTSYGSQINYNSNTHTYLAALPNEPVIYVSWGSAARFCNWLQNGQKTYAQAPLSTEYGSYSLNGFTDNARLMTIKRNPECQYYLPTEDEFYKAAYYDPNKGGPGVDGYWLYPTKSDTAPSNVLSSTGTNNANCMTNSGSTLGAAPYTTDVGSFTNSQSAYGTLDQGGNVWQWNEGVVASTSRGLRGGSWGDSYKCLDAAYRFSGLPTYTRETIGFRIASVPEPSSLAMFLSIAIGVLLWWKRR